MKDSVFQFLRDVVGGFMLGMWFVTLSEILVRLFQPLFMNRVVINNIGSGGVVDTISKDILPVNYVPGYHLIIYGIIIGIMYALSMRTIVESIRDMWNED